MSGQKEHQAGVLLLHIRACACTYSGLGGQKKKKRKGWPKAGFRRWVGNFLQRRPCVCSARFVFIVVHSRAPGHHKQSPAKSSTPCAHTKPVRQPHCVHPRTLASSSIYLTIGGEQRCVLQHKVACSPQPRCHVLLCWPQPRAFAAHAVLAISYAVMSCAAHRGALVQ